MFLETEATYMTARKVFTLVVCMGLSCPSTASLAQDYTGYLGQMYIVQGMNMAAMAPTMDLLAEEAAKEGRSFGNDKERPDQAKAAAYFAYMPSKARTRANLAQFVAKTRAIDPAQADKLQSFFASTDVIGEVGGAMGKIGLRADDVADAYALWWALAWYAVQGVESQSDTATYAAVRAQAARAFAATGKFDGTSDALKQEWQSR